MNEDKELINNLTNRLFFGICLAIPRAEHPQVMNDKVKEVSLVSSLIIKLFQDMK